jgi:glycosyltransferase involved in cell wall biosynthesis
MSLYEGFGLPVLEAIQCGTPVISSNASSLPEVLGDAGRLIDPKDLNALSQSMADIFKDDQLRKTMSLRGIERSALFSWEKTTEAYIQIFNHIKSK